jgi:hypothetical protein
LGIDCILIEKSDSKRETRRGRERELKDYRLYFKREMQKVRINAREMRFF